MLVATLQIFMLPGTINHRQGSFETTTFVHLHEVSSEGSSVTLEAIVSAPHRCQHGRCPLRLSDQPWVFTAPLCHVLDLDCVRPEQNSDIFSFFTGNPCSMLSAYSDLSDVPVPIEYFGILCADLGSLLGTTASCSRHTQQRSCLFPTQSAARLMPSHHRHLIHQRLLIPI